MIGSGAAGSGAARTLAKTGWDVTVADDGKIGGTCLWHGCMPKKALYTSAKYVRAQRESESFGAEPCKGEFDWQSVLAWKWHSQETYAGDQEQIIADLGITLLKERAHFISPDEVQVGESTLRPDHVVIATGSLPFIPPLEGIELTDTSDDALGYPKPPRSLLIVGGGFIGMEFAGIYASFGTDVTVVVSGERPLPDSDADCAQVAVRHLERLGVKFVMNARAQGFAGSPGSVLATVLDKTTGETGEAEFERVLMATGRRAAVDALGLDQAGVECDESGRLVLDSFLRTTNPKVWAAGDAASGMMQTPVASYEGRTVAASIDSGTPVAPDCTAVPTTVFTIPQIANVGMTADSAAEAGIECFEATMDFDYLGAAIIEDDRDGLAKLVFEKGSERLIGAHIAGHTASDLIYGLGVAIRSAATKADIASTVGIHPAYSEVINWAAS